jgi:hypothetical protein
MSRLASVAALLLVVAAGCDNAPSKLDTSKAGPKAPGAEPAVSAKVDRSGDLETRVARLEDNYAKYAEALDFLGKVYSQQKQQQQQKAAEEHDPNAVFAVNIEQNIKSGLVEGPSTAMVTIIEAWDFA